MEWLNRMVFRIIKRIEWDDKDYGCLIDMNVGWYEWWYCKCNRMIMMLQDSTTRIIDRNEMIDVTIRFLINQWYSNIP